MLILDTTVLAYAVGGEHPLRKWCRRLLDAQGAGRIEAATTVEVIQEFVHIQARRRSRADAAAAGQYYAAALPLLAVQPEDLDRGLDLYSRHSSLGAFDSVLAAVALNRQVEAVVSADKGFGTVQGLRWIDPATEELGGLLAD